MNLHQNVIVEEYDLLAVYELRVLPTHGVLLLNGKNMKVGDRFTQADVRGGVLQYKHTRNEGNVASARDEFKYIIPLSDVASLKPDTPRSACLPAAGIPKDGLYTFPINIVCLPYPKEIRNKELSIMEDEYRCLNRNMLFYSSDTPQIQAYFGKPAEPVSPTENNIFNTWKRFSGNNVYENAGRDAPASSDANRWEFNPENSSIRITNNSPSYTGMVNLTKSDSFKMKATVHSSVRDDDLISLIIGYVEVGGVPQTLAAVRSGGFNGSGNTWFLMTTNGNNRTIVAQNNMSAPNGFGNTKSQNWAELGKTQIEVIRKGNQITAKTSQFSFMTSGVNNDALPIDDATTITYTIPSGSIFIEPAQYGFSALSQQLATFEDMEYVEIPPPVVPPVEDPPYDPMWERFPVTYTVTFTSLMDKATILLNGTKMKIGDTFTHKDLDEGRVCVQGLFTGPGKEYFGFTACVNEFKCTSGRFNIKVIEWPYPEVENNYAVMDECSEIVLTPDQLKYVVEFGSTDEQISIVLNPERTQTINGDKNKVEIIPASFTQQMVNDGLVKLKHHCGDDPTLWTERLMFDVCTQKGKCRELSLLVKIIPLPIDYPPIEPGMTTSQAGCTYRLNFYGVWEPIGQCGLWVEVYGRVLPDPATQELGQIIYIPNDPEGPTTVVVVPGKDGNEYVKLPNNISEPPTDGCPIAEVAPNTDKTKSLIEFALWGEFGKSSPRFQVHVGGSLVSTGQISRLKPGTKDTKQIFNIQLPTAQVQNKAVRITFIDHNISGGNIQVLWIKVNDTKYTPGQFKGMNVSHPGDSGRQSRGLLPDSPDWCETPPGPYGMAPYLSTPGECFTDLKGTVWVAGPEGEWRPICETTPGCTILNTDFTPIIKAVDDYVLIAPTPNVLIPGKPVYVKPINTVFTPQPDDTLVPEEAPYTESYAVDEFQWIGPNEFWLPFGTTFDLFFFSNRFYVRYDILASHGNTIVDPNDPMIINVDQAARVLASNGGGTNKVTQSISDAIGLWPTNGRQKVYRHESMWDNMLTPYNKDPYVKGSYLVKIGGSQSIAGFLATQRPKLVPQFYTGRKNSNIDIVNAKNVEAWKENRSLVFSYSGYGVQNKFAQHPASFNLQDKGEIYAHGGAAYGKVYPWLHYEAFKMANNTNFVPPKKSMGWCGGRLSFIYWDGIMDAHEVRNGGTIESRPPSSDKTFTFTVRGYDIVTGEEKIRIYKVHYTKTGRSSDGFTSKTTDATVGTPGGFLPPKPKTAVCYYTDQGEIGSCYILEPPADPSTPGGTGSPSSDYDDFFG